MTEITEKMFYILVSSKYHLLLWFLLCILPAFFRWAYPKPSWLGSGPVTVEARSSSAALLQSPSWSNRPYTAWRWVCGHCPVGKINDLNAKRMGWHVGSVCLQFWINPQQCQQQNTLTPSRPYPLLHASHWELGLWNPPRLLFCVSQRHDVWNQRSQIWSHQTKAQISTGQMSIPCVCWPKQTSSACCLSLAVVSE